MKSRQKQKVPKTIVKGSDSDFEIDAYSDNGGRNSSAKLMTTDIEAGNLSTNALNKSNTSAMYDTPVTPDT